MWQEVFEFASEQAAEAEYDLQAEQQEYISGLVYKGNNGPIYQRFVPRERVFVHGRFLFLYFYSPLEDMTGIPGFPVLSIVLGIALAIILTMKTRR